MSKLSISLVLVILLVSLISASNIGKITTYVVVDNSVKEEIETDKGVLAVKCELENCTVLVKDVPVGNEAKRAYEVVEQKETKLFGFIKKNMSVTSYFDADTKELILTKKPRWAFLSKEN